jgi:hypothetical protein
MTEILYGPSTAHPAHLPPIYILNRTTVNPPHFNATKTATIPDPIPELQTANMDPLELTEEAQPSNKLGQPPPTFNPNT